MIRQKPKYNASILSCCLACLRSLLTFWSTLGGSLTFCIQYRASELLLPSLALISFNFCSTWICQKKGCPYAWYNLLKPRTNIPIWAEIYDSAYWRLNAITIIKRIVPSSLGWRTAVHCEDLILASKTTFGSLPGGTETFHRWNDQSKNQAKIWNVQADQYLTKRLLWHAWISFCSYVLCLCLCMYRVLPYISIRRKNIHYALNKNRESFNIV